MLLLGEMLYFKNECNSFDYELDDVIKLFFLPEEIRRTDEPWDKRTEAFLLCYKNSDEGQEFLNIKIESDNYFEVTKIPCRGIFDSEDRETVKDFKRSLKRRLFEILVNYTGKTIPWGIMTGIRPTKLVNEFLDEAKDKDTIISILNKDYFVTDKKAKLLYEVAVNQRDIFKDTRPNYVSVYIGIPFCPTRCLYCSFSSSTISQYKKVIDAYVSTLLKEIKQAGAIIKDNNLQIESIYIGGGTPTSLNVMQLSRLLTGIEEYLDTSCLKEYTLEAGRPDTIDIEKLKAIKESKVSRISINPQTMNLSTLEKIGRKHTPEEIKKAFYMARDLGFDNINMDLICGLPGENTSMFDYTLTKMAELSPDSLTVHTMSIKRASRLTEERDNYCLDNQYRQVSDMVDMARDKAKEMGLHPYYLYRQKNILGNLENVGYSKKNKESLYNIQIMEERQTIFACGVGAATKAVFPNGRIERAFNVKTVEEYISRVDEMIERKRKLIEGIK